MSGFNLPPGVTGDMIPGNRPEDVEWEDFFLLIERNCAEMGFSPEEASKVWATGMNHKKAALRRRKI